MDTTEQPTLPLYECYIADAKACEQIGTILEAHPAVEASINRNLQERRAKLHRQYDRMVIVAFAIGCGVGIAAMALIWMLVR